MKVLQVDSLKKTFGKSPSFVAVDGVSFHLNEGEILGILGTNGAGKTTILQMLLGILTPTGGEIEYFGMNFKRHRSKILEKVAFASTYISLPWSLTVEQNLHIFSKIYGIPSKEAKHRIDENLHLFGIESKKDSFVASLSAGQSTRLMLAKAFMTEPKILLLDEPTASLDPEISKEVLDLILFLRDEKKISLLFTSHNMREVTQMCDRVLFLQNGKILADDDPENLARSIKKMSIELIIKEGLDEALAVAKKLGFSCLIDHRSLRVDLDSEADIAIYLQHLAKKDVYYSDIHIIKPTLEDYFLKMVKREKT